MTARLVVVMQARRAMRAQAWAVTLPARLPQPAGTRLRALRPQVPERVARLVALQALAPALLPVILLPAILPAIGTRNGAS